MYNKREVGSQQEKHAAEFLMKQGYNILEYNYFHRGGEIDLIAKDGSYLVFVEVKFRSTTISGYPEEAVDYRKMKSIIKTAQYYLLTHGYMEETPCRFDVVVILGNDVRLIQDAFQL